MSIIAPSMQKDVYKEYHGRAYHPQVTQVYANYTSRNGKLSNVEHNQSVAFVGLQYFIKSYLQQEWGCFFAMDKRKAVAQHQRILSAMLGYKVDTGYLEALHDLGYLPLKIKALPEGTLVPYQVPAVTLVNTLPGFQWLTNMIETVFSCENWPIQTSATTALAYHSTFLEFAEKTGLDEEFVPFQGHDFSFRGMFGKQAAAMSGFGHLASGLVGTDTIPAVLFAEEYYNANVDEELVGCSVDATEHSVTCSWIEEGEIEFFRYLMKVQSPTGVLSLVSDTWDFWTLVTEFLPRLKQDILARDGSVVIRPDSGDPVHILTGYNLYPNANPELAQDILQEQAKALGYEAYQYRDAYFDLEGRSLMACEVKGLIECLWDTFGGTVSDKGYRILDEHIGAIYGDAITLQRQRQILQRLMDKGFASKVVLGIGSYSYQHVTRDTHGSAVKATSVVKNGQRVAIFKDPKTDKKKRSAKGLLKVERIAGKLVVRDDVSEAEEAQGLLETVFEDGVLLKETSLSEIRQRIKEELKREIK